MHFSACSVHGAFVIEPQRREDERGFFARMWCAGELASRGLVSEIAQVNTGFSPQRGTLRGLHYQAAPHEEVKIVRCVRGSVFDVVVDLRRDSPTFRTWFGLELTAAEGRLLYVPEGCAHGYLTLEDASELIYFTSRPYAPAAALGVRYDDPVLGIRWPQAPRLVSQADANWPLLSAA